MTTQVDAASDLARLHDAARDHLGADMAFLAELIAIDSGRDHPAGIAQVEHRIAERVRALGATALWDEATVPHVLLRLPRGDRRAVIVTHADTVFPAGTAALRPLAVDGDLARGPGVVDMKGGLVLAVRALELLAESGTAHASVDLLIVGDEEVRTTPPPFMDLIGDGDAGLVLECGRPGGGFVTTRKAGLWANLIAHGKNAHSGTSKDAGHNAVDALAAEVVRIAQLHASRGDLSVSTGMISGGSAVNTVPERAEAWFDVRASHAADLLAGVADMRRFGAHAGITLELVATQQWPAMTPTPAARRLAGLYTGLARRLGVPVRPVATGGMSDGCWLSAAGVPTIDGLGPVGDGDHSPDEWLQISSFPQRAALLAGVLAALEEPAQASRP